MFQWQAHYKDGTILYEIDPETGIETSSEKIDRSKLLSISIMDGDKPLLVQNFSPGQRAIFRRRREITQQTGKVVTAILLGWQQTINNHNCQHISVIFEDGHIENICRWTEDHPWFYSISSNPVDEKMVGYTL